VIQIPKVESVKSELETEMKSELDEIVDKYSDEPGPLITVLQDINEKYNYLPKLALKYISERLNISLSQVYSVATFYTAFSLTPRGKHLIKVCQGTACHVRGGAQVLSEIERVLQIKPGETTEDMNYSLETVNCLGACALGPVVVIDNQYYPTTPRKVEKLVRGYEDPSEEASA
jgi:NADH-quinone oxidoreductase subunit E